MHSPSAILLAFANDWNDGRQHLRRLLDESKAICDALASLVEDGTLDLPSPIHNATIDDVFRVFRKRRYRNRICIFHFGGHAGESILLFENKAGSSSVVHANSLAGYLGKQRGLVLVFLNGCSTETQVHALRNAGVKAVVATTAAIRDEVAAEFATAFYAELATRSLQEAFDAAEHVVRVRRGDTPHAVTRDVDGSETLEVLPWPWILDCHPSYKAWTLSSTQPRRRWARRPLIAVAAISFILATLIIVSTGKRPAACYVPWLHSLCTDDDLAPASIQLPSSFGHVFNDNANAVAYELPVKDVKDIKEAPYKGTEMAKPSSRADSKNNQGGGNPSHTDLNRIEPRGVKSQLQNELGINLDKLGEIAVLTNDLATAKTYLEEGLSIRRRILKVEPASIHAQRELSKNLEKLGDLAVQMGDLTDAKARLEESLFIRRKLATALNCDVREKSPECERSE